MGRVDRSVEHCRSDYNNSLLLGLQITTNFENTVLHNTQITHVTYGLPTRQVCSGHDYTHKMCLGCITEHEAMRRLP